MEFDKVETIFDIDKNLLEKIDEFKNERILKHTNDEGKYNIISFNTSGCIFQVSNGIRRV